MATNKIILKVGDVVYDEYLAHPHTITDVMVIRPGILYVEVDEKDEMCCISQEFTGVLANTWGFRLFANKDHAEKSKENYKKERAAADFADAVRAIKKYLLSEG